MDKNKEISNKIEELKKECKNGYDNEAIHGLYDQIMSIRMSELDPKLLRKINKIVKGINFWYA